MCGFLAGAVIGTLVAWAKLVRTLRRPRRRATGTPPCFAASPTSSSSTSSISAAAPRWAPSAASSARRASSAMPAFAHRRHRHRHRVRRLSGRGVPRRLPGSQPRRARGRAVGRHEPLADVPPHHRAAGAALRDPRPRQYLAARPEGIRADLGHRPRRAVAPVAHRRRLDPAAVRLLHHGGGALPAHHLGVDPAVPAGGNPFDCAACGGLPDGFRLHARHVLDAAVRRAAHLEPRLHRGGARRRPGDAARPHADVRHPGARLDRPRLRVRVPRHRRSWCRSS